MSEPTLREWKKMFWYPECPPGAALWGRLSIQTGLLHAIEDKEMHWKVFFVFGFVKLKCCSLQFCRFLGDGNIFEKEEPIEKLVPYGSNNNNNKDNNILGCVQCLMWMHYNGVRSLVPSGAQLGVKGAESLVGLSNVNLVPNTHIRYFQYICHQSE